MQKGMNNDGSVDNAEFEVSKMSKMIKSFDVLQPDENGIVKKTDSSRPLSRRIQSLEMKCDALHRCNIKILYF